MMSYIFRFFVSVVSLTTVLSSCQSSSSLLVVAEEPLSPSSTSTDTATVPITSKVGPSSSSTVVTPTSPARLVGDSLVLPSSSGEWITFGRVEDKWYAEARQGRLPIKSGKGQPSVGAYLSWLGNQTASVVRSRLHIIPSTASPTGATSVYLGKLGLLGGTPADHKVAWCPGPHIKFVSGSAYTKVWHISLPAGYRCWGYRECPGSIVQQASCTVHYVTANTKEEIDRLEGCNFQNERALEERLATNFVHVVHLGALEGESEVQMQGRPDDHTSSFTHAALVVYVNAKRSKLLRQRGKVDVRLEIGIEPVSSASLVAPASIPVVRPPMP